MSLSRMTLSRSTVAGATISSSRPDKWLVPHQSLDPSVRRLTYGPIRPMDWTDRPLWRRLFHWG